jgi:hypothetical protein
MTVKISKKSPLLWLYAGGALLLLVAIMVWCVKLRTDPERVFWGTIQRSLSTQAVTIQAKQSNQGVSTDQTIRYSLGANNMSHSLTTLTQGQTTVVNEMVATPTADYTRYVHIKTDQKKANGSPIDFSKVLGVWAKSQATNQFFTQAVFGATLPVGGMGVPMANLQPEVRNLLIKQIRDDRVYQISFDQTKKKRVDGRMQYTYEATIKPVTYVKLVKQFSSDLGLHGLDQIDPSNYKNQKPFKLLITVDVRTRQVVAITSAESHAQQTYTNYGVPVQIELPKKSISGTELQQLLSNLQ